MASNLIIGSHVNVNGKDMLLQAVREAVSYNANTFMFYTGAPQNTFRKPISSFKVKEAKELMQQNHIDINNVVVHAPYIINLANIKDPNDNFAVKFLIEELGRVNEIGCKYLVLHPGSHVGKGIEGGLDSIVENIDLALHEANNDVMILLETMSGKGTELGTSTEQIKYIIEHSKNADKLGVCMDTCHLNDAGYNLAKFDDYLDEFDKDIGISKVKVIHINDSKNVCGAHKDRHENFGFGEIGFDLLLSIVYNPRLDNVIKILETPWVEDYPPYKLEIQMIRDKKFNPNMKEELLANK